MSTKKRTVETGISKYIANGGINDIIVTMITFKYTSFKKRLIGSFTIVLKNRRRAKRHICEMIIAITIVTSGAKPKYNSMYDIGKLSNNIPPTTN